jgi:hypothetical protein
MRKDQFPYTFTGGIFAGRTFQSNKEYEAALTEARRDGRYTPRKVRRTKAGQSRPVGDGWFRLEIQNGDIHTLVEGKLGQDMAETLLSAIAGVAR